MKKLIVIICVMSLLFAAGIASAQELLIQPKQETQPQQAYPTDRVPSYSYLGSYINVFDLLALGMESISPTIWRMHTSEISDNYIWLDDTARVIIENIVFSNLDPSITHDTIVDYIVSDLDKGFVTKLTKCYDGTAGVCKTVYDSIGSFIQFPVTVFLPNDRDDVMCFLGELTMRSEGIIDNPFYCCLLLGLE